jgi:hypothetical protein
VLCDRVRLDGPLTYAIGRPALAARKVALMGKRPSRRLTIGIEARRPQPQSTPAAPAPPANTGDAQTDCAPSVNELLMSGEREDRHRGARFLFTEAFGGGIMQRQIGTLLDEKLSAGATDFIGAIIQSVKPRDLVERMLCVQMAWTHARLARLSVTAASQENIKSFAVVHQAADAATNTFRRLMQALADYRAPRRGEGFTAVKNQYNANQQVVQNGNPEIGDATNEQGLPAAAPTAASALPLDARRPCLATTVGASGEAVAVQHRSADGRGQGQGEAKRDEARRAVGGADGDPAGDREVDAAGPGGRAAGG